MAANPKIPRSKQPAASKKATAGKRKRNKADPPPRPRSRTQVDRTSEAIWEGQPDKSHSVGAAVAAQLTAEQRWPPNDITKIMGSDYRYDQLSMGNFLAQVQVRLASGNPPFRFVYDGHFVMKALQAQVGTLMIAVTASTT
jgi:hypothetical protein